ncbi:hypothetical protein DSO57_1035304 [Entomophthora muscae]|uniref:Uncharacterized protein n=1 Tax=Entomophthora muscae TaxID=34485 RepID=A0ACC2UJV6_9FUNG|nr:hypothetical protein DSO57_1035304 [Entomophthora muscae]
MKTISTLLSFLALGAQAIPTKGASPSGYYRGPIEPSYEEKPNDPVLPNYGNNGPKGAGSGSFPVPDYGNKPIGSDGALAPENYSIGSTLPGNEHKSASYGVEPVLPANDKKPSSYGTESAMPANEHKPVGYEAEATLPMNEQKPASYGAEAVSPANDKKPSSYNTESNLPGNEQKPSSYKPEPVLPAYGNKPISYGTENLAPSYEKNPINYGLIPAGGFGRVNGQGSFGGNPGSGNGIRIKHGTNKSKVKARQGLLGSRVNAKNRSKFTEIIL